MRAPPYAALVLLSPLLFPHPAMIAKIRFQLLTSVHVRVTWAGFDKLELGAVTFKHVLLLGYQNGFQVIDVDDASNFSELVSKCDGPVTFLQMLPIPRKSDGQEGFRSSHPLLLVVARDEDDK